MSTGRDSHRRRAESASAPVTLRPWLLRYEITSVLGAGSFGIVRQAVDRGSGRRYACKTVPKMPKRGKPTPRYLLKLQQEVDAMQQLGGSFDAVYLRVLSPPSCTLPHTHPRGARATLLYLCCHLNHGVWVPCCLPQGCLMFEGRLGRLVIFSAGSGAAAAQGGEGRGVPRAAGAALLCGLATVTALGALAAEHHHCTAAMLQVLLCNVQ